MNNYYKSGDWNAICDICGFKYKASQLRKRWDGLVVCTQDWETRHPQDLIKIPKEDTSVPWSSPEPPDAFVSTVTYYDGSTSDDFCTHEGKLGLAGIGQAGCMQAGVGA